MLDWLGGYWGTTEEDLGHLERVCHQIPCLQGLVFTNGHTSIFVLMLFFSNYLNNASFYNIGL